ncbi:MAG TPA: DUF5675 family protein [Rhizomicrobium sp.]|jgi:hypothetical protein|nr:DUF5675 family protein [Rhizomicrobium sp.]
MNLRLIREPSLLGATLGVLFVDGRFRAFSLEDEISDVKVPGRTCIPEGRYQIRLTWSPKFNRVLPELVDVPGFTGVRIHAGNTKDDTAGCVLLGVQRSGVNLVQSRPAVEQLQADMELAKAADRLIWIAIENPAA